MRKSRGGRPVRADEVLPAALKALGVPSARLTREIHAAWERAADPAWRGLAAPERLVGGVLVVSVASASLRQELAQFHRDRLLHVLQAALVKVPLVGLKFVEGTGRTPAAPSVEEA